MFCIQKYHDMEAEVVRKDGLVLVREMAAEVKNMLDFKMNAVMVRNRNCKKPRLVPKHKIHYLCVRAGFRPHQRCSSRVSRDH